jgi:glycosyltransferase involved in cell wall biosynthesis
LIHLAPNYTTAISSFLMERAIRLGVCKDNIRVIPNGVDLTIIPENAVKIPFQVFNHSRFSWEKAHEYIIKAWSKVIEKYPQARLLLVNDGPEKEKIVQMVKEQGLENSVVMKGLMPQKDVFKLLAESEVFICPSLAEGLGNVFIEAQAAGAVPIGTRVGGIPDVIQNMDNGILVEPKNSEQIAEAIIKLLDDRELLNRLREKGLVTSKLFEWDVVMDQIEKIYEEQFK